MRPAVLAVTAFLLAGPVLADDASPDAADQPAIEAVISRQLDAFRTGDATTAESFASPGIQEKFPDPQAFLGMVRHAYGALVSPKSTRFGELTQTPLGLVQKLTVVGADGTVWTAAYTMTLIDGQWRISGCYMLKSEAVDA